MIPGLKMMVGDRELTVPAISLGMLRTGLLDKIRQHDEMFERGEDQWKLFDLRGEIIIATLRRNYSEAELSDEIIWNLLDLGNILQIWTAILGRSGFTPGEAEPGTTRPNGISDQFTNPSPPPTDGELRT
jgi:hypothetical protein